MHHLSPLFKTWLIFRVRKGIVPWQRIGVIVICLLIPNVIITGMARAQGKNVKAGSITMDLTARMSLEYNDNISASGTNDLTDFIFIAGIDLSGNWDISPINSISFNLGANYLKYFDHPELNSGNNFLLLTPDTEIAFKILIKGIEFRIYDKLSFSTDPTDSILVDPETQEVSFDILSYNRFDNRIGIGAELDLNQFIFNMGYERSDIAPLDAEFDFTDRTQNSFRMSGSFMFATNMTLGLEGSFYTTEYQEDYQNSNKGYTIGPYLNWEISRFIRLALHTNWTIIDFDNSGDNSDVADTDTINLRLRLSHAFNRNYSHSLNIERRTYLGFIANSTTVESIGYAFALDAIRNMRVTGSFTYEKSEDSGGVLPESSNRFIFETKLVYKISPKLNWQFNYYIVSKNSNVAERIYDQNRFITGLSYDF